MITTLLVKTDKKLKQEAQKLAKGMGIPLSAVINESLRTFVVSKQASFRASLMPNAKTSKSLRRILRDADEGKNMSPVFHSGMEMDKYLARLK